jgi:hypothetical protein
MGSVVFVRAALLIVSASVFLASCGSDSSTSSTTTSQPAAVTTSTSSSTTTQPEKTTPAKDPAGDPYASVETVLVGGDCQKFVTQSFVNQAYGGEQACEAAVASGGTADSLKTGKVTQSGDHATISVVPHGGPSSGEKVTAKLVLEDGTWKIESLESNVPVGP